jgi:fermentation-respiration switch protein FrsA (DUF1100 family)
MPPNPQSSGEPTVPKRIRRTLMSLGNLLRVAVAAYLTVLLVPMIFEEYFIYPAPKFPRGDWTPSFLPYEDVYFQSADGTQLHGWYVEHPQPRAHLLICHGNAEHVAYLAEMLYAFRNEYQISLFAFDYRGYGRSEGCPNEAGVLADGHAAQAWFAQRAGIQRSEIVIMGRSLGGAVAIDLAATNGARGLILENTFTSMPDVAARLFWWMPVRLLMHSRFDSLSKIRRYHGPLLQSHGTMDEIVPFEVGQTLFEAAPGSNKRFFRIADAYHNDLPPPEYFVAIKDFIDDLPKR